jgi:Histidine kinase/Histidine kinase-, DNA gyrase B-, and HSP90-like ATPase/PAS fold
MEISLPDKSWGYPAGIAKRDALIPEKVDSTRPCSAVLQANPQPLWVHDRTTLNFLLMNDAMVRQYGWSREELLSRSVPILAAPAHLPLPPLDPAHPDEPYQTQHKTKAGSIINTEVWSYPIELSGRPADIVFSVDSTRSRLFGHALSDALGSERRRIAQEMHDGLGQELTGLALSVHSLANRVEKNQELIAEDLNKLADWVRICIHEAQRIVQGLWPLTDAKDTLEAALAALAQRSSLSGTFVHFRSDLDGSAIELTVRNHLYRIAQEAVQNALKHSGAARIAIELSARRGLLVLSIQDDGTSMQTGVKKRGGLGAQTMRYRAHAIGGELTINRTEKGGSTVICEVPLKLTLRGIGSNEYQRPYSVVKGEQD